MRALAEVSAQWDFLGLSMCKYGTPQTLGEIRCSGGDEMDSDYISDKASRLTFTLQPPHTNDLSFDSISLTGTCSTQQVTIITTRHQLTLKVRIVIIVIVSVGLCLHRLPIEHHPFPRLATGTGPILASGVPQTGEVLYCKIHQVRRPLSQHLHSVALQQFCQPHRYLNTHGCCVARWQRLLSIYRGRKREKISQSLFWYRVILCVFEYWAVMWFFNE